MPSPHTRLSSGVRLFLTVFGTVLLAVTLRSLVVGTMLGLLRADHPHRFGRGADLAGFHHRCERGRCTFAGTKIFAPCASSAENRSASCGGSLMMRPCSSTPRGSRPSVRESIA
jgi:hypothetical protein